MGKKLYWITYFKFRVFLIFYILYCTRNCYYDNNVTAMQIGTIYLVYYGHGICEILITELMILYGNEVKYYIPYFLKDIVYKFSIE